VTETRVPVYLHPADRSLYDAAPEQGAWLGVRASTPPAPTHPLAEGDRLTVGDLAFDVKGVPGHSPGGVAFIGHGVAFVGDALFAGSIGRTDLPGGDGELLLRSIHQVLLTLPEETVVYSGHGPATTIGEERQGNPFLKLVCLRCGAPVSSRPWGCKNPCANCGFVYPLGDCSD
jgi:hydroxyacylglutathione hydrolase